MFNSHGDEKKYSIYYGEDYEEMRKLDAQEGSIPIQYADDIDVQLHLESVSGSDLDSSYWKTTYSASCCEVEIIGKPFSLGWCDIPNAPKYRYVRECYCKGKDVVNMFDNMDVIIPGLLPGCFSLGGKDLATGLPLDGKVYGAYDCDYVFCNIGKKKNAVRVSYSTNSGTTRVKEYVFHPMLMCCPVAVDPLIVWNGGIVQLSITGFDQVMVTFNLDIAKRPGIVTMICVDDYYIIKEYWPNYSQFMDVLEDCVEVSEVCEVNDKLQIYSFTYYGHLYKTVGSGWLDARYRLSAALSSALKNSFVLVLDEHTNLIPWGATVADVVVRCDGVACDPERNVVRLSMALDIPMTSDKFVGTANFLSSTMYPPNVSTKLEFSRHENFPCGYCWGNNAGAHKRLKYNHCFKIRNTLPDNIRVIVDDVSFDEYSPLKRRGLISSFGVSGYLAVDSILVHSSLGRNAKSSVKICYIEKLPHGCVCGDLSDESCVVGSLGKEVFPGLYLDIYNSDGGLMVIRREEDNHRSTVYKEAVDRYLLGYDDKYSTYVRESLMKEYYSGGPTTIFGRSGKAEDLVLALSFKYCLHDDP